MSIKPDVGDICILEHRHFIGVFVVAKIIKQTATMFEVQELDRHGTWQKSHRRKIDRCFHGPITEETAPLIRAKITELRTTATAAIEEINRTYFAQISMMAAKGKP